MEYLIRQGTINRGGEYEEKIAALLSLQCSSSITKRMWMGFNAEYCGAFDDLVIHHETQTGDNVTYMIQLKHKDEPTSITRREFLTPKPRPDFFIQKYEKSYNEIKHLMNDPKTKEGILRYIPNLNEVKFVIFTNRSVTDMDFLQLFDSPHTSLLNAQGEIYRFSDENNTLSTNTEFLKQLLLFTKQIALDDIERNIQTKIEKFLQPMKMNVDVLKNVTENYIAYVTEWTKGQFGKHYLLTNEDVHKEIRSTFILMFACKFNDFSLENYQNKCNITLLHQLFQEKTITILRKTEENYIQLFYYLYHQLTRKTNENHKDKTFILGNIVPKKLKKSLSKNYTHIKKDGNDSFAFWDLYKYLWSIGEIPLILEMSSAEDVKNVISVWNMLPNPGRLVVLLPAEESVKDIKADGMCLVDLSDLIGTSSFQDIIDYPIKLQNRSTTLNEIIGHETCKTNVAEVHSILEMINTDDLLRVISGKFTVGSSFDVGANYINRSVSKVFVNVEVLSLLGGIYFVNCQKETRMHLSKYEKQDNVFIFEDCVFKVDEIINFINNWHRGGKYVIFANQNGVQHQIHECDLSRNIHIMNLFYDQYVENIYQSHTVLLLEWVETHGSPKQLLTCRVDVGARDEQFVPDEQILNYFSNSLNVISAGPGTGKSILMDYIGQYSYLNNWVLRVDLKEHIDYYESQEFKHAAKDPTEYLQYFNTYTLSKKGVCSLFNNQIFKRYVDSKQVLILFDGFDEIAPWCSAEVIGMVKILRAQNYKIWVTTRPVTKQYLEMTLNTFTITLKNLTEEEQSTFLTKCFLSELNIAPLSTNNLEKIATFTKVLLEATKRNLSDWDHQFTGIPLQCKLLSYNFSLACLQYVETGIMNFNDHFNLLDMYELFLSKKLQILSEKFGPTAKKLYEQSISIDEYQQLHALKMLFGNEHLKELNIDQEIKIFKRVIKNATQLIQKDGVVIAEDEINIGFIHRTFAEYHAAKWLSLNFSDESLKPVTRKLLVIIFNARYTVVRNIFDRLLCKNLPLHNAVINWNVPVIKELLKTINNDDLHILDEGGRSVLHLCAAWGGRHPIPGKEELLHPDIHVKEYSENFDSIIELMITHKLDSVKDEIMHYTPFNYAILGDCLEIANLLKGAIDEKETIKRCKRNRHTYIYYCSIYGYLSLFENIVKLYDVIKQKHIINAPVDDVYFYTPLHLASMHGQEKIVKYILSIVSNLNVLDRFGATPFQKAAYSGNIPILKKLIGRARTFNVGNTFRTVALYNAVYGGLEAVRFFVENDADIHAGNPDDDTVLDLAINKGDIDIVQFLLEHKVDINRPNKYSKKTPLHRAVLKGNLEITKLLVKHGADINSADINGRTVLNFAEEYKPDCFEVYQFLSSEIDRQITDRNKNQKL